MSKSLEALERLCKVKIYQKEASAYDYLGKEIYKEEINTIKQDLERKEELRKENQELKGLQELNKQGLWNLKQENQKLKKGIANEIDILIARRFDAYECEDYQTYNLLNDIMDELEKVLEE